MTVAYDIPVISEYHEIYVIFCQAFTMPYRWKNIQFYRFHSAIENNIMIKNRKKPIQCDANAMVDIKNYRIYFKLNNTTHSCVTNTETN